eukprot:scaffold187550_cov56-Cyclotella_meneghiniana.AAC.1
MVRSKKDDKSITLPQAQAQSTSLHFCPSWSSKLYLSLSRHVQTGAKMSLSQDTSHIFRHILHMSGNIMKKNVLSWRHVANMSITRKDEMLWILTPAVSFFCSGWRLLLL